MIRWILIILIVVVVVGSIYASATSTTPVDAATARTGRITAYIEERAKTRLPETLRITMPFAGRILPIDLVEGTEVEAGQIVATIEPEDLETAVAQAQARVDRLKASIEQNNDTRLELTMIEGLNSEIESFDRAVEAAEAKTEASKARETYRTTDLARKEKALAEQAATPKEVEEAELADIEARVNYRTDVLTLRALEAIRRAVLIGPRAVRQYIDKKALSEAVLARQLAEAEADLQRTQRDLARGSIATPAAGVVLHRALSSTRMLPAGELLMEIGDLSTLEVEVEVLSQDVVAITPGDEAELFGPAIGVEPVRGVVTRIEPRGFTKVSSLGVEQQRVLVIIAFEPDVLEQLAGNDRELGVGYRIRARMHTDVADDAVVIPRSALFRGAGDAWRAFVIRDGRARLVDLTVGLMNDREVQVLEGVRSGESVILAPETSLEDGARVSPRVDGES
jgi:HlyD family secretion protein